MSNLDNNIIPEIKLSDENLSTLNNIESELPTDELVNENENENENESENEEINNTLFIYNIHFSLKNDKNTVDNTFEHYNKKYKLEKLNNFSLINEKKENDECIIM